MDESDVSLSCRLYAVRSAIFAAHTELCREHLLSLALRLQLAQNEITEVIEGLAAADRAVPRQARLPYAD